MTTHTLCQPRTRTITYGIIGCGMMGQEHLRNIALLPGTAIGTIFEPDAGMRARAARIAQKARFADSIEDLLGDEDLDCLLIASPNFRHVEQLQAIAARRPLPVLVEKPLFTSPEDLAAVDALAATYPAPVWVAMEYRYMPPVARMLQMAEAATGGIRMLTIREHRFPFLQKVGDWNRFNRFTGGTFVEKCCHFFDLMRLAIGSDPVRVMAMGGQALNHLDETHLDEVPDIFDHGYVTVEFANGVRAMLELCMFAEGARYQEEITAIGPKGKIEALVPGPTRFWPRELGQPPVAQVVVSPRHPKGPQVHEIPVDPALLDAGDHNGSTFYQHQRFLELVRGERAAPEVSVEDGKWAVRMGLAAQQSMTERRMVELDAVAV
ncbi:Gfo/Idh/MocA family protein [Paracoccus rhizosphaerae]|uniref:Gfo/Idh/MocA family protein n=1 Tax=Paracoccus rhizosphaerae TaxID=1133347 RepID=A0ABV6CST4_9RHOB|nr:Gfo/Idh/MocA family oxidoreductase [Paracoccus rhizosphaerae]